MNLDLTLLFGSLMSISFALCFAPQIYTMYKNKSSKDVSLGMVILQICGNIGGLGLAIVSTSIGIMSDNDARMKNVGGEIICRVF